MPESIVLVWFGALMAMAVAWLVMIVWVFRRLRTRHAAAYESIGSPSLFWNNSMRNNWLFFKFLFLGQWQGLNDPVLTAVARLMQVWFVVYTVGFFGLAACMIAGIEPG